MVETCTTWLCRSCATPAKTQYTFNEVLLEDKVALSKHFITQYKELTTLENGAYHSKRRPSLEKIKWDTLWLAGLAQSAKKSRTDMYNMSVRLWAPSQPNPDTLSTKSPLEVAVALSIPKKRTAQ